MGIVFEVNWMRIFVPENEAAHERPHVHISRQGASKRVNMKMWLDNLRLAKKHPSFSAREIKDVKKIMKGAQDMCMREWVRLYGKPKKRG